MAMNEREVAMVVSAQGGDSNAFEELYNLYYSKIFALARMTVKNEADSEDILQQTFINAWRNLSKLVNPAGFNTWLQKITLNLSYSLLRNKNIAILRDAESEMEEISEDISDDVLPSVYAERDDLRMRLGKIIDGLSEVQKQTIVLYYFNEQKVEEIAYIMDCTINTVKTRLFLARKAIRSEVEEEERKSGEKFYGIVGIPLLPFGEMFAQHLQSQMLTTEVSSSVLGAVTEAISQGASSGVQVASGSAQATSLATGTAQGSALSGIPLSVKIIAIAGVLLFCTGSVFFGMRFLSNLGNSDTLTYEEPYNDNAENEQTIIATPAPTPEPTPETISEHEQEDDTVDLESVEDTTSPFWPQNSISAGGNHTVGLKTDGTVVAVGWGDHGELNVHDWTDIIAVSAGTNHTVGLRADGTVFAVGYNQMGQINTSDWTDIIAVSARVRHTIGLRADGTVVAVGWNNAEQLNVNGWTDIVAISAGDLHTVGLRADGTVVAVGDNQYGQLNVSDWTDIVAISAGGEHTVGLRSDGTVVAAGSNYTNDDRGEQVHTGMLDIDGWTDIVEIAAGSYHTVGLRADGTVITAGIDYILAGDNEWFHSNKLDVEDWTDIIAISASWGHTVGLKSDGTVVAVGWNGFSQLSVSDWTDIRTTPP